ncbi:hypothetical protein PPL_11695 [Heterostelium album PN500]|uniref:Uncharacterized protein n=1 Tax=Heterostelium pallidum (strain ATCC 26659 / Pp 5 / PN500) TaxID=670386 RepID=D3BU76_HETP5|nr:hypothetical protein PPL_11695 [Heterostelium album PN500]EFA75010.1 hypothetical protein PPL_11695 [Heterostelium album PN500]|eukprot:XP_020427144.1 hypothetical protein PPL_11695 [Heterostelium album PN500]
MELPNSKTALNAFTVMLAKELAADGFKVHSVAPGFVKTPMNNFTGELEPEVADNIIYEAAIKDNDTGRFLGSSFIFNSFNDTATIFYRTTTFDTAMNRLDDHNRK